ncbi:ion transporter, putative, partial [Bodo saltans]
MIWLTFELIVRLIFCQDLSAMLKLPFTWVDIVSNIPYYIELGSGARIARILILIRLLRLTRILRVFDLSKHNVGMQSVWGSVVKSVSGLTLLMLLLTVILFVGSSIIYISEMSEEEFDNDRNILYYVPSGRISPFQSIIHTLWYVITTITTTGYGDDVPITPAGYTTASVLILIG